MREYRYVYEPGKLPDSFRAIPFIAGFERKYLGDILASSRIRQYEKGETIVAEGSVERWMYILLTGGAEIRKAGGETLAVLERAGEIFGELSLIRDEARTASVVALKNTVCLVIDKISLEKLDTDARNACYAAIFRLFVDILAKRLKNTTEKLVNVQAELEALKKGGAGS